MSKCIKRLAGTITEGTSLEIFELYLAQMKARLEPDAKDVHIFVHGGRGQETVIYFAYVADLSPEAQAAHDKIGKPDVPGWPTIADLDPRR